MNETDIQNIVYKMSGMFLSDTSMQMTLGICNNGWRLFAATNFTNLKVTLAFHLEMERAGMTILHHQVDGYRYFGDTEHKKLEAVALYFIKEEEKS